MCTHNVPFLHMKKKTTLNYPKSAAMGFFSSGLKNEFKTVVVNKPSVFEPLNVVFFLCFKPFSSTVYVICIFS